MIPLRPKLPPVDVSIVVPVRDGARTLPRVLDAVADLDPPARELIVVDDGSRDDSVAIARARGAEVLQLDEWRGPAAARNAGARHASGAVLLFVDADVVLPPDALAVMLEVLDQAPGIDGVQAVYRDEDDYPSAWTLYQQAYYHHYFNKVARRTEAVIATYCTALRREAFELSGGFDEGVVEPTVEDERLGYRFHDLGYRVRLAPELSVLHDVCYTARSFMRRRFRIVLGQSRMLREDLRRVHHVAGRDGHHPRNMLLAVALLPGLLLAPAAPWLGPAALAPLAGFVACHLGFWSFVARRWGPAALLATVGITLVDAAVIGCAGAVGVLAPEAAAQREPACA